MQANVVQSIHYMPFDPEYGLHKTENELRQTGLLIDTLPDQPEVPAGMIAKLKYKNESLYWELEEDPQQSEMGSLKVRIAELEKVQAASLGEESAE